MEKKVVVSAPGKLMLFGEHAVVYGRPCIVTATDWRIRIKAEILNEPIFGFYAPGITLNNYEKKRRDLGKGTIPKEAKFVEAAAKIFFKRFNPKGGARLESISEFSPKIGLGSSSAAVVCTIKALSELFDAKLKPKEIFELSYKAILDIQGKGSGFDVAAAIYGGTLYFTAGGKKLKPIEVQTLPLIVGYSGVKDDTASLINQVGEKAKVYPKIINGIYDEIARIVESGKKSLEKNDLRMVGELMNFNQGYLKSLGVSTKLLSDMVYAAVDSGAWGAKLSGAGGGDCIIALAPNDKVLTVKKSIEETGGKVIDVKTNAEGLKLEKI